MLSDNFEFKFNFIAETRGTNPELSEERRQLASMMEADQTNLYKSHPKSDYLTQERHWPPLEDERSSQLRR
jgi:hypothetical protein